MKKNDLEIGLMVAIARQERSLSQDQLADRMRELGHNWTRQTVWGVEKGTRAIRLPEAYDLEDILGISFFDKADSADRSRDKLFKAKRENEVKNTLDRIQTAYDEAYALGRSLILTALRISDGADGELAAYLSGLGEGLSRLYSDAPEFLHGKDAGEEFIRLVRDRITSDPATTASDGRAGE
ncbi:helix-turn-helix transcriptional regulator [Pseudoscardovia radai]|uniref:helix-turn-helix transcriptional regulator n=1 Tax=Pseudoscardovia radai TaxID=987066 RepID=UPI0039939F7F